MKRALHLLVSESSRQVNGPVAETEEELLGLFIAAIHPSITQTGIHLVYIIKRYPRATIGTKVTFFIGRPDTVTTRYTAYIALTPFWMVLSVGIGTCLQFTDKIFHSLSASFIAHRRIDGHRREIMATYMTVKTIPVGIAFRFWSQSCFLEIRSQQTVAVVLQQCLDVQVTSFFQGTFEQGYITK